MSDPSLSTQQTYKVTVRRTLNLGNFETISSEYTAEGGTLEEARIIASYNVMCVLYAEAYRVFNVRSGNLLNAADYQLTNELATLTKELELLHSKK